MEQVTRSQGRTRVTTQLPDHRLISALRDGDESAADELFHRYYGRLVDLVQRNMGWRLREVEHPSDVVQSVFLSVFGQGHSDKIEVASRGSLWPLLVTIALNKVRNRARFWARDRRDRAREIPAQDAQVADAQPTAEDASILKELIELLLEPFPSRRRQSLEHILQGYGVGETADSVGVSERTVYNTRQTAMTMLAQYLKEHE